MTLSESERSEARDLFQQIVEARKFNADAYKDVPEFLRAFRRTSRKWARLRKKYELVKAKYYLAYTEQRKAFVSARKMDFDDPDLMGVLQEASHETGGLLDELQAIGRKLEESWEECMEACNSYADAQNSATRRKLPRDHLRELRAQYRELMS